MDLLQEIDSLKHSRVKELLAIFPNNFFKPLPLFNHIQYGDLCHLFQRLEKLITSANQQWWDEFFLHKYLSAHITPRGLWILKTCSFLAPTQQKEWCSISEFCTNKWMQIIVTQRRIKYEQLVHQIQILFSQISKLTSHLPTNWLSTITKKINRREDLLTKNKLGKFHRDLGDYSKNRIFSWKRTSDILSLMDINPRATLATHRPIAMARGRAPPMPPKQER